MHHPAPTSSALGFLPDMYSFSGPTNLPEFDLGSPSTSGHLQRATLSNNSWETRCLRKHRRRVDDEGCSAKRRRLMVEAEVNISENSDTSIGQDWPTANSCPPLPAQQASPALSQPCPASENLTLPQPSSALLRPETESSCMEIEAAQRKLQEIEDRITLEDDDEDEDLDVEPAPRRPVLVISDSLKEGLQRGISDILPHTVAQSVSHSCMELVLWRPPDDPFCKKRKGSLQKQRKQQTVSRQPPTPCPSPTPHSPLNPSSPTADTHSSLYSFPVAHSSGEEDMEM
ncbi:coiled-coil domain-containing protein 117 isoform X1 [Sander lucioperca]|uniref:coiled-coil domain-containing protein 117 isoform X1 n=1 Tax=Sander lucioperca TaxID=283035 RepID=UPI00125E0869|nr:coiled-coil domain-containing protein 117 isoform X1 [Sander lucioperca]XP_031164741.1 coiled-coil domain-containing protein 117 isoform X1 [Sander lucioperca]XP_031164742.1 coiled-coil domain-containing protein 117 isoform X1 [Sander lucioperca]XP_035848932.1 coiled-coil domain-containing protein 117 isoform X1 [Sander lucioperca]